MFYYSIIKHIHGIVLPETEDQPSISVKQISQDNNSLVHGLLSQGSVPHAPVHFHFKLSTEMHAHTWFK